MQEIALFSGKIYTPGTNFTRPPVVTVATNLNSASIDKISKLLSAISQTGCTGLGVVQCSAEPGLERSLVEKKT